MKTNAADYFRSLSPLKAAGSTPGISSYETRAQNGRSGRCHCCPYGYHIDLDFVRYCDMLTQGSKNDSPTLRQLKKIKRARRRQTKSMEVLLGLSSGKENEIPDHQSQERLEIIEEPSFKSDSLGRDVSSKCRRINSWREKTPPLLPLRQSNNLITSLHSDVIGTTHSSSVLNSNPDLNASEALEEAVLDFEEMLENSQEVRPPKNRSETLPPDISSLHASQHHGHSHHYPLSPKLGSGLGRSHSLPRQLLDDTPFMSRRQRTNSASSLSSVSSAVGQLNAGTVGTINGGFSGVGGYVAPNTVGIIQQQTGPPRHLSEALATLSAAQGYPPMMHPDFDTMSVTSAMSGVSTSTLQSIRDQMATSLNRLKDLEEEVKTIPMLQVKLNVLKEEKRFLIHQLKGLQKGDDATLLLPPSLDGDLSDLSEDELEGRLVHLKNAVPPRSRPRRCESPLRVNLEEFHSYRRARRGSVSEGSEADSAVEDFPLFIKEANDNILDRRMSKDHSTERRRSLEQSLGKLSNQSQNQSVEARLSHSMPNTPLVVRKHVRDASTNCRVLTRDIGVTHVGTRTRSVGISTDKVEIDKKREIKAKPCMHCYERNKKTYENKNVGTPAAFHKEKVRRLSMSNVSLESFDPEDIDFEMKDALDKDGNSKNAFLQKLGRKSAIISRLSEPQLAPPILTFDNSTNTEQVKRRDQRVNTTLSMTELFTKADLNDYLAKAKKEWEVKQKEWVTKQREWSAKQKEWETKEKEWETKEKEWETKQKDWGTNQEVKQNEWRTKQKEWIAKQREWEIKEKEWETKQKDWGAKEKELENKQKEWVAKQHEWEAKQKEWIGKQTDWGAKQRELEANQKAWETKQNEAMAMATRKVSKPVTSNFGIQVSLDDPSLIRTTFQPLLQSVGVMVKPTSVDVSVGKAKISDNFCDKCANIKTRSVASGDNFASSLLCDKCANTKTRSVAVGDFRLKDLWCEKCSALQTRTVGCSSDRISDRICDRCDNIRTCSVASETTSTMEKLVKENQSKPKVNAYVQTRGVQTRTISVNTMPINLKKEELICETSGPPSPALTPEVERRSYGSSGVRICDKCHETIQSVAKDIVNTSGTASATNLPPLPPQMSKIPRLVDLAKVEPRLDLPVQDLKVNKTMSSSLESSLTESQLSSMNNSFFESKTSTSTSTSSFRRTDTTDNKSTKTEQFSSSSHEPLVMKLTQKESFSESSKPIVEVKKTVESKETKGNLLSKTSISVERSISKPAQPTGVTLTSGTASKASSGFPSISSSPQVKRVPYNRQQTYTKFSEGLVNLGFEENADGQNAQKQKEAKIEETSSEISQSTESITTSEKYNKIHKIVEKEKKEEQDTEEKKTSEAEPVIQGRTKTPSSCSSSSDSEETCDETSLLEASFSSQPDVASSFQSASSLFTTASERSRKKSLPPREMKAALKVLNDSIGKPVRSGQQLTNAVNIVQREWFKVSSQKDANPHAVEDYMDVFEEYSKLLLQRVVNLSDVNGNTAMHYAVSHGNFDVVSVLLDSKVCNINQQNKAGYTATMLVSLAQIRSETHASVVQRLFQLGDVNIKASQHGQTALMLAVSHGRLDMVRMLVVAGAEINIQDEDGSTALMCSAEHGHLAIVKFLLGHPDTDPSLMDNDGSTALTIAVEAGHKDVGVLLYKHMNLSRGSSPYSSMRVKRSRTPTMSRSSVTPPPRSSAPSSPGRSRKSSAPVSPGRSRQSSASLSNLMI